MEGGMKAEADFDDGAQINENENENENPIDSSPLGKYSQITDYSTKNSHVMNGRKMCRDGTKCALWQDAMNGHKSLDILHHNSIYSHMRLKCCSYSRCPVQARFNY